MLIYSYLIFYNVKLRYVAKKIVACKFNPLHLCKVVREIG